jgi:hypothetical protein
MPLSPVLRSMLLGSLLAPIRRRQWEPQRFASKVGLGRPSELASLVVAAQSEHAASGAFVVVQLGQFYEVPSD